MKKITTLFIFFTTLISFTQAQVYTVSPNDTVVTMAPPSQLSIFDIYQRNISGDTIQLAWTKVYESIPAGWDYSLCDHGTCYPGFPMSGTMALVTPPDSGFLGVNVDPYLLSGTLTIRFYVYETSAPAAGDTLTWIITAQTTGLEDLTVIDFTLYPNPSTDFIYLKTSDQVFPANVAVYDMNGKMVLNTIVSQANQGIDLSGLVSGNYIFELRNQQIIRKPFIKK